MEVSDRRMINLIKLIRRVEHGTIEIKIQNGIPIRAFKTTENIDLNNDAEVDKVK
jgi:hypothetical protein